MKYLLVALLACPLYTAADESCPAPIIIHHPEPPPLPAPPEKHAPHL